MLTIRAGAATDQGLRRDSNEDALVVTPTMCAVADGMGGHEAGEVASGLCVSTLGRSPLFRVSDFMTVEPVEPDPPREIARQRAVFDRHVRLDPDLPDEIVEAARRLRSVLWEADQAIQKAASRRAGTTVTGVWMITVQGRQFWLVFNVGDSRTYRLNRPENPEELPMTASGSIPVVAELQQLTTDHSEVQYLVSIGQITQAQALVHPRRNVITRALGTGQVWEPDVWVVPARIGDRLLLCSDGLTGELSTAHIARVLATVAHPKDAAEILAQAAVRTGGRDNITAIVLDAVAGVPGVMPTTGTTQHVVPPAPGPRP